MSFKYTDVSLAGGPVPPQFRHMVGNGPQWVEAVRETCRVMAGTHEHQDLAPHELDVEQSPDAEPEAESEESSQDVSTCDDDLPDYESDDAYP